MMHSGKIVLVSKSTYQADRDESLLREFVENKIDLFCVVGVDAEKWEDALDWLCIGEDGLGQHCIITTSHPNESEEDVIEFARLFHTEREHQVEVIRV